MRNLLIIGAGGFLGAVMRYLAVISMQFLKTRHSIPMGTLLVNVVGCLLIGFLAVLAENTRLITPETRNFLVVGILGAFTTFSTFSYESVMLAKNGSGTGFLINVGLQLALGFVAVWVGMNAGRLMQKIF